MQSKPFERTYVHRDIDYVVLGGDGGNRVGAFRMYAEKSAKKMSLSSFSGSHLAASNSANISNNSIGSTKKINRLRDT